MCRGGQAWDGKVILKYDGFKGGGSYEYRLVRWRNQPRIAIRWNAGGKIANCPAEVRTSVTLDAALYPAIIKNILPPDMRDETRACLGPDLAVGNYPNAVQCNPNENYRHPQDVTSPQDSLGQFKVVLDKGPGDGAYMIGWWGSEKHLRVIAFRWNGTNADQKGFPISRNKKWPIWIILPDDLREKFKAPGPFVNLLPPDVQPLVIEFLTGQRDLP